MRWLLALGLLLLGMMASAKAGEKTKPANKRPRHVVLIVADDLGNDLGCFGNTAIRTPNLDALARRGVCFTRAYAAVSSCSPSRASVYTGLPTHQSGQYGLHHPPHSQSTHPWVRSMASLLRSAGYWTGLIGKFHVGPDSIYNFHQVLTKGIGANRDVVAMAKVARTFISKRDGRPIFLVMAFSDPHRAAKGFGNEKFAKDPHEVRYDPAKVIVPYHLPDTPEVRQELAEYYQAVSRMDRGVGQLLDALRELGVLDDTLIIFLSDNGIPFPGAKTTLYEAGLRLPLIVARPKGPHGTKSAALVSYLDVTPTVLDWTGAKGPTYKLTGRSLLPVLDGKGKGHDAVFASHQFHEITMSYPMRMVCTTKYKLIVNLSPDVEYPLASDLWGSAAWQGILKRGDTMMGRRSVAAFLRRPREELYDLTKDPNELKNVAADAANAEVLVDLRRRLHEWRRATNDPWLILDRRPK